MKSVEADYEDGVLRPVRPLRLRQGERVQVVIKRQPDPNRWDFGRLAKTSGVEDSEFAAAGLDDWAQSLEEDDEEAELELATDEALGRVEPT